MSMIPISARMAKYYRYRDYKAPKPPITFQPVFGYPPNRACPRRLAFVGEGPGQEEDEKGAPFIGRTGWELDRFLESHGIDYDNCYYTNITRVFQPVGNPTEADVEEWEWLLREELGDAKPYWIAALGRLATRYFLGDVDMDTIHGIPYIVNLPWMDNGRNGDVVIIPIVHPAAGFHNTEAQALIAYDFAQLEATLSGRVTPRRPELADRYPDVDYRDLTDSGLDLAQINASLAGGTKAEPLIVSIDTEGLPGNPWGLSYSTTPGTAFVIRKVHEMAVKVFYQALVAGIRQGCIYVILHNSLHDLRVLRELGIPIPDGSFVDTMVLAYHLCIEPQGLKALAYRHCGMQMDSYDEIVQDAQDKIAVEYYELMEALVAPGIQWREVETGEWWYQSGFSAEGEWQECQIYRESYSEPISIGPFRYIPPYSVRGRDKKTGEMTTRIKKVQQIDTRVKKALKELRSGKITPAQLRKRWEGTDELLVETIEEQIGPMREADLNDVPLERAVNYAARDADATIRIFPILREKHQSMMLGQVSEIDHSIIPMVDLMQATGIEVDIPYFKLLSADLQRRMEAKQQEIKDRFGVWINPNSGDQVADLLFSPVEDGGYGLIPTKHTKGTIDKKTGEVKKKRGSTVDKVLEGMRTEHEVIPMILDYRGLNKAKTSFADVAIRKAVQHPNGRWYVHCLFRITRVSSGRLSATGPNLMAVVGGKLGEEVRNGYIAGEGFRFSEWDLNQIEMRGMASESNETFLIDMFTCDEDVHTGTASRMFKLNLPRPYHKSQVSKLQRDAAKRTGFGVITGIQAPGLVDQMRLQGVIIPEEEATKWIKDYLDSCPRVRDYMNACANEAWKFGYVRDWAGRLRYLPGIHSPYKHVRAEASRQSHSHKIQAGAQEIMKIAMAKFWTEVYPHWKERGKVVIAILQIHDAIMVLHNLNDEELAELDAQVRACMYSSAPPGFRIPLDAGMGTAAKWGELEH